MTMTRVEKGSCRCGSVVVRVADRRDSDIELLKLCGASPNCGRRRGAKLQMNGSASTLVLESPRNVTRNAPININARKCSCTSTYQLSTCDNCPYYRS